MADKPAAEQTEAPTDERLRKARKEGRVPNSQEVPSVIVLTAFTIVLVLAAPGLYQWFYSTVRGAFGPEIAKPIDISGMTGHLKSKLGQSILASVPFLIGGAVASVLASLLSSGWALSPAAIKPKLSRISPISGLKNMLSLRSVVKLLISLAKLAVIVLIAGIYLLGQRDTILALWHAPLEGILVGSGRIVFGVLLRVLIGLAAIALVDLIYQRWQYKRGLRMTRQEVKEERKQYELAPELKGRMRAMQIAMMRKRMLQDVPEADVVLANPTHVAVAIKYDASMMDAPTVVAKGPDLLAQKIKEIARENDVPVIHRPELARAVYKAAEVGQTIPQTLFVAVAEVLAMIYRLKKKRYNTVSNKY